MRAHGEQTMTPRPAIRGHESSSPRQRTGSVALRHTVEFRAEDSRRHRIELAAIPVVVETVLHSRIVPRCLDVPVMPTIDVADSGRVSATGNPCICTRASFVTNSDEHRTIDVPFSMRFAVGDEAIAITATNVTDPTNPRRSQWISVSSPSAQEWYWCHDDERSWLRALDLVVVPPNAGPGATVAVRSSLVTISEHQASQLRLAARAAVLRWA